MNLRPSFYALYRRSRYGRIADNDTTGSQQDRRELFAVAAVAFALRYDKEFRVHFLRCVCGSTDAADDTILEIEVQPHDHSDLAIKIEARHALIVVEFKVGADLQDKQNPGHEKAFFGNGGYGKLILEEGAYKAFLNKTYVVIDEYRTFGDGERRRLECKSRSWNDIAPDGGTPRALWADLLDSLGELGVAAFQFHKLKNMHNAQHTKQAVAMHQTLSLIASRLKFGGSGGEDINLEGEDAWYGRNIPNRRLLGFIDLEIRVKANGNIMGWFGYQSGPGYCERAVWFYCGSEERAQITYAFLRERLAGGPPGRAGVKGTDAWYQFDGYAASGDAEWFHAVFRALADKKQPKIK